MIAVLIVIGIVLWFYVGHKGFVYWWTQEHDLTRGDNSFGWIISFVGPLTWLIGWTIHGDMPARNKEVLKKRRGK